MYYIEFIDRGKQACLKQDRQGYQNTCEYSETHNYHPCPSVWIYRRCIVWIYGHTAVKCQRTATNS